MIKRFAQLLRQGSKEGAFDNLLLLLRFVLLCMIPYMITMGVILMIRGVVSYALLSFLFALSFLSCMILSYKVGVRGLTLTAAILIDIYSVICAVCFGAAASFQQLLLLSLFIFWYDITRSTPRKIFLSLLSLAALCYIRAAELSENPVLDPGTLGYTIITYTNNVFCILLLSVIAWFFCTQFAEAERKLFLSNRELRKISHTDPLTHLMNRRFAEEEFEVLEKNYGRKGEFISVAIGDIDFFKRVNDTYGHDAGDYVLEALAAVFENFMKDKGFVVRWGGEEFLFVFEHSNGDDAYSALEALRKRIERAQLRYKERPISVTMTFGVEEYGYSNGMTAAIEAADKKLYKGKEDGRNRVVY
ncbi:MAG: GGDEF domain-containing protein [Lachnospiraceae bacterium]|nr:GGDEF domain-containing protein [Lachnospiraceae bacterium]